MKRMLSLILSALLLLSLTACGGKQDAEQDVPQMTAGPEESQPDSSVQESGDTSEPALPSAVVYDTAIVPERIPNGGDIVLLGVQSSVPEVEYNVTQYGHFFDWAYFPHEMTGEEMARKTVESYFRYTAGMTGDTVPSTYTVKQPDGPDGEFRVETQDKTQYVEKTNLYNQTTGEIMGSVRRSGTLADTEEQVLAYLNNVQEPYYERSTVLEFVNYCRSYFQTVGTCYTDSITQEIYQNSTSDFRENGKKTSERLLIRCYLDEMGHFYLENILVHRIEADLDNPENLLAYISGQETMGIAPGRMGSFADYFSSQDNRNALGMGYCEVVSSAEHEVELKSDSIDFKGLWEPAEDDYGGVLTLTMAGPAIHGREENMVRQVCKTFGATVDPHGTDIMAEEAGERLKTSGSFSCTSVSRLDTLDGARTLTITFDYCMTEDGAIQCNFQATLEAVYKGELETPFLALT